MPWLAGGLVLVLVGALLRRLLHLGTESSARSKRLSQLDEPRDAIYRPVALEVETQAAILGVSLNDAFEEREAGRAEIAWRLVQLSAGEWSRLALLSAALLRVAAQHLSRAQVVVPLRGVVAYRFRSAIMVNYVRMHELLDQLVFGSSLRFQLHLRVLRRAAETLTAEFRRRYRYADRTGDHPEEFWKQLDLYFHDFDLIAKEALLALRTLLLCLPDSALPQLSADLQSAVGWSVRSTLTSIES